MGHRIIPEPVPSGRIVRTEPTFRSALDPRVFVQHTSHRMLRKPRNAPMSRTGPCPPGWCSRDPGTQQKRPAPVLLTWPLFLPRRSIAWPGPSAREESAPQPGGLKGRAFSMETNGRPFDVVKKIGTGTSHRDIFPEFSRDRLGARPIFSQPLWASGCLGNRKPGPMAQAMSMAGPLARNHMNRLGEMLHSLAFRA